MQTRQPSLFARDHTILGVCEGLGEDLGINPVFLRLALCVPLFLNWQATIVGYLAVGVVVLATRLIFPNPRVKAAKAEAAPTATVSLAKEETSVEDIREPLPLAA